MLGTLEAWLGAPLGGQSDHRVVQIELTAAGAVLGEMRAAIAACLRERLPFRRNAAMLAGLDVLRAVFQPGMPLPTRASKQRNTTPEK